MDDEPNPQLEAREVLQPNCRLWVDGMGDVVEHSQPN